MTRLSERFQHPPRFIAKEPYLRPEDPLIEAGPGARAPRLVPLVVLDYGNIGARFRTMKYVGRYMMGSFKGLRRAVTGLRDNPHAGNTEIDEATLAELEEYAHELGATDIGYTRIDPDRIFKGHTLPFGNAIVISMEMDYDLISQAPSIPTYQEIHRTYCQLGVIVNSIAEFLRERGFDAYAGPAIGSEGNFVPLGRDAGMGEVGKHGLLITEKNGPRVRLAAVYTDIENLPFAAENPHEWVRDYCDICNACVRACPVDAIFEEPAEAPEGGPVFIDHVACAMPFSNDHGCTVCIKVCPFMHKGRYETLRERVPRAGGES
jgi:NAD-dependent dihydropyrimidine dehydrogenase PreA subunit